MLFNSVPFIFFFAGVVISYFAMPHRYRWLMLLAASYYFYMCWKPEYVVLILFTTSVDFLVARKIEATPDTRLRRKYLYISLVSNLSILFGFKYFNFFSQSVTGAFAQFNIFVDAPVFHALLPVGISFYTFQSLSYVLDVYRTKTPAERHFGYYALYVSFWPQLVAGPIERSWHLLPQLRQRYSFSSERVTSGLRLMLAGMLKKVVIADQVAVLVNRAYSHPDEQSGAVLAASTVFFAIQIYCDFSGYTDVARGAARVMGYDLMENFRAPYLASSIHDFWRRWHISLSTWFRDYLYIPLGGNRKGFMRWNINLLTTFFISGLWHGANWTFVIWGVLHGCYLIIENFCKQLGNTVFAKPGTGKYKFFLQVGRTTITFLLVCFAWIFFRANTLQDAAHIIIRIADTSLPEIFALSQNSNLLLPGALTLLLFIADISARSKPFEDCVAAWPIVCRWSYYTAALWAIALSAVFGVQQQFIYFQF